MLPELFENNLRNYDAALSLRWGPTVKCWCIERKCNVPPELVATLADGKTKALNLIHRPELSESQRYMLQKACEESYSANHSKRVVIYTKQLDNRVFDALKLTDLQATGNLQHAVERSKRISAKKKKDRYEAYEPLGKEVVDIMGWANRKHSTEVDHGKAPKLVAEAFHKEAPVGTRKYSIGPPMPPPLPSLLDQFGKPMVTNGQP
jgi:hypothetical protein